MEGTTARLVGALRRLQEADRKRGREDDGAELHAAAKRVKELEEAVKSSDGDAALFYELCADHELAPAFNAVVLPHIGRDGGAEAENGGTVGHPGIHLHRLSAILLRMRSERLAETVMGLREERQDLLSMVNTLETERIVAEARLKELDSGRTPPAARDDSGARAEEMEGLRAAVLRAEDKLKKQGDQLAGAHQQRVHAIRASTTAALDKAHSKATAHLDAILDGMEGVQERDKMALVTSFASYVDDCRCVLGSNLV